MVPAIVAGSCSRRHHRRRAQKHVAGVAKNCHFNREKSGKSRGNQSIEQLNKSIHLRGRMNGNILVNKPNILETYWSIHIVEPNKYQPPGGDCPAIITMMFQSIMLWPFLGYQFMSLSEKKSGKMKHILDIHDSSGDIPVIVGLASPPLLFIARLQYCWLHHWLNPFLLLWRTLKP